MKWCFLANEAQNLTEFLGRLGHQAVRDGDECMVIFNGKITEYTRKKYFPQDSHFISKVDWCREKWRKDKAGEEDISWRRFYSTFDRYRNPPFRYGQSVAIISQLYQLYDTVFAEERPDVVVNEPSANIFTEIAYALCQKYGIPYLGFIGSKFSGRMDLYDLEHTNSHYEEEFSQLDRSSISDQERSFAQNFVKGFVSHELIPPYRKYKEEYFRSTNPVTRYLKREMNMVIPLFQYMKERAAVRPFDYASEITLRYTLSYPWTAFKRKMRTIEQRSSFDAFREDDDFFLFPLHVQPESSTSVLATYFSDQLNTIRNTAFALPFPLKLYVREHPSAVGHNQTNFYRQLKKIPQVVLISPKEDMAQLVEKSKGVITLTSTVGLEAALAGKPVYVLGDVFYQYHPVCQSVRTFEDLRERIEKDLQHKPAYPDLDTLNTRFIVSYYRNTVPGEIGDFSRVQDRNDYKEILQALRKFAKAAG